ncbi:MAG: hypothetical protein KAW12_19090 [Candidatus Aminicenantes bacterium]|nr:hypothetical protein [Candidatus Aminicenantes bacterium]
MQPTVPGTPESEQAKNDEEEKYTRKFNEMAELLDFVLTMKIDYYQGKFPGKSRDEIMSLINYEILESKYREWNMPVPPGIKDFLKIGPQGR